MQQPTVFDALSWQTSTACTAGNCVQAAPIGAGSVVAVRDSKNPDRVLTFSASVWNEFLDGINRGDFDSLPGSA